MQVTRSAPALSGRLHDAAGPEQPLPSHQPSNLNECAFNEWLETARCGSDSSERGGQHYLSSAVPQQTAELGREDVAVVAELRVGILNADADVPPRVVEHGPPAVGD